MGFNTSQTTHQAMDHRCHGISLNRLMNPVVKVLFQCISRFSIFVGTHFGIFVCKFLIYLRMVYAFPQKLAWPLGATTKILACTSFGPLARSSFFFCLTVNDKNNRLLASSKYRGEVAKCVHFKSLGLNYSCPLGKLPGRSTCPAQQFTCPGQADRGLAVPWWIWGTLSFILCALDIQLCFTEETGMVWKTDNFPALSMWGSTSCSLFTAVLRAQRVSQEGTCGEWILTGVQVELPWL